LRKLNLRLQDTTMLPKSSTEKNINSWNYLPQTM